MDIRFVDENIFELEVDALIYFTDNTLLGAHSSMLLEKAGSEILEPIVKLNGCPTGDAKIIPAFQLISNYVILSVMPDSIDNQNDRRLFQRAIFKIFELIEKYSINSVAMDINFFRRTYGEKYVELLNATFNEKQLRSRDIVWYMGRV